MSRQKSSSNFSTFRLTTGAVVIFLILESHMWVGGVLNAGVNLRLGRTGGKPAQPPYNAAPLVPIRAPQESDPVPLPKDLPTDPTDDQISSPLYYHGAWGKPLYEDNPCNGYHEYGEYNSHANKNRRHGCGKSRDNLKDYLADAPSEKCKSIQDSRCFEFKGKVSRCYVKVNVDKGDGKYVLINNC